MLGLKMSLGAILVYVVMIITSVRPLSAQADPVADFYRGKQVRFITGY